MTDSGEASATGTACTSWRAHRARTIYLAEITDYLLAKALEGS